MYEQDKEPSPADFDNPATERTQTVILKLQLRDVTANEDNS